HYLLILAAVILVCRTLPREVTAMVLAISLTVQIVDLKFLRNVVWAAHSQTAPSLNSHVWRTLGQRHRHIILVPPCTGTPQRGQLDYDFLPRMAVRQGMTINSYYSGRYDQHQLTYFCSETDRIKKEGLKEDTAYVFSPEVFRSLDGDALH